MQCQYRPLQPLRSILTTDPTPLWRPMACPRALHSGTVTPTTSHHHHHPSILGWGCSLVQHTASLPWTAFTCHSSCSSNIPFLSLWKRLLDPVVSIEYRVRTVYMHVCIFNCRHPRSRLLFRDKAAQALRDGSDIQATHDNSVVQKEDHE